MKLSTTLLTLLWTTGALSAQSSIPSTDKHSDNTASAEDSSASDPDTDDPAPKDASNPAKQDGGLVVRTEIPKQIKLSDDTGELKILTPWAPKPLQSPPVGWRYITAPNEKRYKTTVELKSGKQVSLSIAPYILVPEDSPAVVQITEPGYIPTDGYRQKNSVSASLTKSNKLLSDASKSLDKSIADLKQLLDTLPSPNPESSSQP